MKSPGLCQRNRAGLGFGAVTYHWHLRATVTPEVLDAARQDMVKLIRASPFPLADGSGEPGTSPVEPDGSIYMNGVGADGGEPFWWPADYDAAAPAWSARVRDPTSKRMAPVWRPGPDSD
jgi:hypothetical protein